jgi:hypothetical protein
MGSWKELQFGTFIVIGESHLGCEAMNTETEGLKLLEAAAGQLLVKV